MQFIKTFTLTDFLQMEVLERQFYDESHITPHEEVYKWYKIYPYTICALKNNNQIIGFINLFPIKQHIFDALKHGVFNDKDLTLDGVYDISTNSREPIYLFLSCVVIDRAYQGKGIAQKLLRENLTYYDHLKERIKYVITDNVTEAGERFSQKLGLKKVTDTKFESVIYMGEFSDLQKSV